MLKKDLFDDPVVKMLLEDVKAYLDGNKNLQLEAKRSIDILKKEYDISPMFIVNTCDSDLSEVSDIW